MKHSPALSRLEIFVKVVETGSLSQAARDLDLTPSAVSKSLTQLETYLGNALMKRTTRTLALTDCGRTLFDQAQDILRNIDEAVDTVKCLSKPSGILRVTTSIAFGCTQLPQMLHEFMGLYPEVNVVVLLEDKCVNLLEENIDVALRITSSTQWNYAARKLSPIEWVCCASPAYLHSQAKIELPEDLRLHACLVYPSMTHHGAWGFIRDNECYEIKIRGRANFNSSLALIEMALDGAGIICVPKYSVWKHVRNGRLVQVLPEYKMAISHALYAMYFRTKYNNPALRAFVDFLARKFEPGAPWEIA